MKVVMFVIRGIPAFQQQRKRLLRGYVWVGEDPSHMLVQLEITADEIVYF